MRPVETDALTLAPPGHRCPAAQRGNGQRPVTVKQIGHSQHAQTVHREMPPHGGNLVKQVRALGARLCHGGRIGHLDRGKMMMRSVGLAECQYARILRVGLVLKDICGGHIGVQDRRPTGLQAVEYRRFFMGDAFNALERFQMRRGHGGDHRHMGPRHA